MFDRHQTVFVGVRRRSPESWWRSEPRPNILKEPAGTLLRGATDPPELVPT